MIGALEPVGRGALDRRMRRRRIARIVLATVFAIVWIPVAIVMAIAGASDRRA